MTFKKCFSKTFYEDKIGILRRPEETWREEKKIKLDKENKWTSCQFYWASSPNPIGPLFPYGFSCERT
jgi:hypothetical protein